MVGTTILNDQRAMIGWKIWSKSLNLGLFSCRENKVKSLQQFGDRVKLGFGYLTKEYLTENGLSTSIVILEYQNELFAHWSNIIFVL